MAAKLNSEEDEKFTERSLWSWLKCEKQAQIKSDTVASLSSLLMKYNPTDSPFGLSNLHKRRPISGSTQKMTVDQEEQSVDDMLLGNKQGVDYLLLVLNWKTDAKSIFQGTLFTNTLQ